jgi:NADH-quinone oxidoreductase subunit L
LAVVALGIYLAYARYGRAEAAVPAAGGTGLYGLLLESYRIDDLYDRLVVRPFTATSDWLARVFDPGVIDGLINGVAKMTRAFSLIWRETQTGNIQHYLIGFLAGTLVLLFYYLRQQ